MGALRRKPGEVLFEIEVLEVDKTKSDKYGVNFTKQAGAAVVPPGVTIPVGPVRLFDAFDLLGRGDRIDLDGAASALDFNVDTGESHARFAVYCLKVVGGRLDVVESGASYDTSSKSITGVLRCQ